MTISEMQEQAARASQGYLDAALAAARAGDHAKAEALLTKRHELEDTLLNLIELTNIEE